jgi:hypothetical protein
MNSGFGKKTNHIAGNKELLNNYKNWDKNQFLTVANNEKIKIIGRGLINFFSKKFI